jgi:glycerate kinase
MQSGFARVIWPMGLDVVASRRPDIAVRRLGDPAMSYRVLIAPSGFKERPSVDEAADAIAAGVRAAMPDAELIKMPVVDGGKGFTEVLARVTGGRLESFGVTGTVGQPVRAQIGWLGGRGARTAVLEMAAAAGLRLAPRDARDRRHTTSYGVGELIRAALDGGAERILVGCGDSGINDGGAGMAQALGVALLGADGRKIRRGGAGLADLARIDLTHRDRRLGRVRIDVAVNWRNVLLGPRGAARVFGPQTGATPEIVAELEAALTNYAAVIERDVGVDVAQMPGGGASGGLGAGLHALLGARLHPRYDIVFQYLEFDSLLEEVDVVITAEGRIDERTPRGKVPAEVGRRAHARGLPVIALAGSIGRGANANLEHGIDADLRIVKQPCGMDEATLKAHRYLREAAEQATRVMLVGAPLKLSAAISGANVIRFAPKHKRESVELGDFARSG